MTVKVETYKNMHGLVWKHIYKRLGLITNEQQRRYLIQLQPIARELHESYRNKAIYVDYNLIETQVAYVLRYYVGYSRLLPEVLLNVEARSLGLSGDYMEAAFFGVGPAPELTGLLWHVMEELPDVKMLTAHLYDSRIEGWSFSRSITTDTLAARLWKKDRLFDVKCNSVDIRHLELIEQCRSTVANCQFVVYQNCLNETGEHMMEVGNNIVNIFRAMPLGGLLIIIDRAGYDMVKDTLTCLAFETGHLVLQLYFRCLLLSHDLETGFLLLETATLQAGNCLLRD